jgi:oligosaccharide reducing-end xylanase
MLKSLLVSFLLFTPFLLTMSPNTSLQSDPQGAFFTGEYPNLLSEWGRTDEEIGARIDEAWDKLFYGDDETERIYYPVGDDMAYLLDVNNADVRSEGMSYGMMIAVQLDKQEEFNRIWKWAKTYMYQTDGEYSGYFAWHNRPDGSKMSENPAPDGEEWFVTALFFAAARWGNGEGIFDYQAEANAILHAMLHKADEGGFVTNMFDSEAKMVVFVPTVGRESEFTDPSYHLPHFYELWARWADEDNDFWAEAARVSRDFWHITAHPETGLMPNYAYFTGEPRAMGNYGEYFYADAWRCIMNVAVDYLWFAADPWQVEEVDRQLAFFYNLGIGRYNSRFKIDGTPADPQHRGTGLIAMNATGALAASTDTRWEFIEEFWNTRIPSGQFRYYDGLLYFFGLLHLSGNFRIYDPTVSNGTA